MSDDSRVVVEGDRRLAATLRDASDDLRNMEAAGEKSARLILTRSRTLAPKLTGRLAGSLVAASESEQVVSVSSDVVYAGVQEWGWATRNIRARNFLVGPATDLMPVFVDYYADDAEAALRQVKGA